MVTAPNSPAYNSLWQVRTDSWCGLEESATQLVLATTHQRPTEKLAEILVTKGRMQTAAGLTERCRHYIEGIRAQYKSEPLPQAPPVMPIAYVK